MVKTLPSPVRTVHVASLCVALLLAAPSPGLAPPADRAPSSDSMRSPAPADGLPGVTERGSDVPSTLDAPDRLLQRSLDGAVDRLGLRTLVEEGRLGVALVDLRGDAVRFAAVHPDRMFYAASLPKIAVLLAAFDAVERRALQLTPELSRRLVEMIRFSSNAVTNQVLQMAGGFAEVARVLRSPRYRLYDPDLGGGLWVGKAYARQRYWKRDPVANLSHGATPRQVARFFVMLHRGELVSPEASTRMKRILGDPGMRHKFVRGLEERPGARIFRKSGTWRDFHADGALIERPEGSYVLVGLVRDAAGDRILQGLAVAVDDLLFRDGGATADGAGPAR